MLKALTPIFALIIAVLLGFTYIWPQFTAIKVVQSEEKDYVDAIAKASELKDLLNKKVDEMKALNPVARTRLDTLLPKNVNEVSLIIDLDALAQKHHLSLSNIQINKAKDATGGQVHTTAPSAQPATGGSPDVVSTSATTGHDITFTVLGTYDDFRTFLDTLEQSLVFFDVMNVEFSESTGDLTSFTVTLRTYTFNTPH